MLKWDSIFGSFCDDVTHRLCGGMFPISENTRLSDFLFSNEIFESLPEIRRMIKNNGMKINDKNIEDVNIILKDDDELTIGKHMAYKFKVEK